MFQVRKDQLALSTLHRHDCYGTTSVIFALTLGLRQTCLTNTKLLSKVVENGPSSYPLMWPHCSGSSLQLYDLPHCDSSSEWQDVLLWVLCQRPGTTAGFNGHQQSPECHKLAQISAQANLGCIIGALYEEFEDPRTLIILSSLLDRCGQSHKVNLFFFNNASFLATGQYNQKIRQKWLQCRTKIKSIMAGWKVQP